jgi:hypothetical protein
MTKVVDVIQSQFDALTFPIWLALVPRLTLPRRADSGGRLSEALREDDEVRN